MEGKKEEKSQLENEDKIGLKTKTERKNPGVATHAFKLSTRRCTKEDYHKFEASLGYIPGQDSGVAVLQAVETIRTASEGGGGQDP